VAAPGGNTIPAVPVHPPAPPLFAPPASPAPPPVPPMGQATASAPVSGTRQMLIYMQQRQRGLWGALALLLLVLGGAVAGVLLWHNYRIDKAEKDIAGIRFSLDELTVEQDRTVRKLEDLSQGLQEVRAKVADHSSNFASIQAKHKEVDRQTA